MRLRSEDAIRTFLTDDEVSSSRAPFSETLRWGHVPPLRLKLSSSQHQFLRRHRILSISGLNKTCLCTRSRTAIFEAITSLRSVLRARLCGLVNRWRWWISSDVQIFRQYLTVCRAVFSNGSKFLVNHIICNRLSDCCHPQLFLRYFEQLMAVS